MNGELNGMEDGFENKISFKNWNGMAKVYPRVKHAVDGKSGRINGWTVMGVVLGVDTVCVRISARNDNISLVSGLFLVAVIAMLTNPSELVVQAFVAGTDDLSATAYQWLFGGLSVATMLILITSIVFNSVFNQTLRSAIRDADSFNILLTCHKYVAILDLVFLVGNFALAGFISVYMCPYFGIGAIVYFVSYVVMALWVTFHFVVFLLKLGHPVKGWYRSGEYDLRYALRRLEYMAEIDTKYQDQSGDEEEYLRMISMYVSGKYSRSAFKEPAVDNGRAGQMKLSPVVISSAS